MQNPLFLRGLTLWVAVGFGGCRDPRPAPATPPGSLPSAAAGSASTTAATSAPPAPGSQAGNRPDALGRAGPVQLGLPGLQRAVAEVRVLGLWRGKPAPEAALDDPLVRRRILTRALETQLIRQEVARRGLSASDAAVEAALVNALAGRGPRTPVEGPIPERDLLAGQVAARFDAPAEVVRRVAADLLESEALANALLDTTPEATLQAAWVRQETQRVVDLVQVGRVPTAREIDAAVRARGAAIDAWYAEHADRFNQPERVSLHRMFVRGRSPEARARLDALRARVLGGEAFEAVAQAGSEGPQARRGGRVGSLAVKRVPEVAGLAPGALSAIHEAPGGLAFVRLNQRLPAVVRPVTLPVVRREIAAELLRAEDALPSARAQAEAAAAALRADPSGPAVQAVVAQPGVTRRQTPPFSQARSQAIPGLGLAPDLFKALFEAEVGDVVGPMTVRQHYVIARVVSAQVPDPSGWPAAKAAFSAQWRSTQRGTVVDRWISQTLTGQPMWVDSAALRALTRADLLGAVAQAP